jgi:hypothetical protein
LQRDDLGEIFKTLWVRNLHFFGKNFFFFAKNPLKDLSQACSSNLSKIQVVIRTQDLYYLENLIDLSNFLHKLEKKEKKVLKKFLENSKKMKEDWESIFTIYFFFRCLRNLVHELEKLQVKNYF